MSSLRVEVFCFDRIVRRFVLRVKGEDIADWQSRLTREIVRGMTATMLIYKIFRADEWAELQADGETMGAPVDLADGFVHFSTAGQAAETAARHFAGTDGLILLAVNAEELGAALKWEPSRGGALFPHLYRELRLNDVLWAKPLPLVGGHHQFPADMA